MSGKLKVESGKLNVHKYDRSDKSDKCISKSSQISILPKQHNVKDLSDFKQKTAFTLSEVLITLGIIGVIATMTTPVLIKKYQQAETVSKLKKVYNTLSNAIQMSRLEHGDVESWNVGTLNNLQSSSNFADEYIIPYIKTLKVCKTNTTNDCSYSATNRKNQNVRLSKYTRIFLVDGSEILLDVTGDGTSPKLIKIAVDINGQKGPNRYGKDVFLYALVIETTDDKYKSLGRLNAFGQSQSVDNIKSNCLSTGEYCSAYIIQNGWKLPYDYPW